MNEFFCGFIFFSRPGPDPLILFLMTYINYRDILFLSKVKLKIKLIFFNNILKYKFKMFANQTHQPYSTIINILKNINYTNENLFTMDVSSNLNNIEYNIDKLESSITEESDQV